MTIITRTETDSGFARDVKDKIDEMRARGMSSDTVVRILAGMSLELTMLIIEVAKDGD